MALSNLERQRRYRKRHLGEGGRRERLSCLLMIPTKRNVERLAFFYQCTITDCVEKLINERTAELLNGLDEAGRQTFFSQGLEAVTEPSEEESEGNRPPA